MQGSAMATPTGKPPLSVVVPVYNAETFIADAMRELTTYLKAWPEPVELIIVDDGSTDQTSRLLKEAVADAPIPVQMLRNARNRGKGAAIYRGMKLASGHPRVFLDADLAYPPSEIAQVCAVLSAGADVVIACRVHPSSRYVISPSFFRYLYTRHVAGRIFSWLAHVVLLPGILDSQAGLKGFTAAAAEQLFSGWLPDGFSFDLAVLFRAQQLGLTIEQMPVVYRYDTEPTTVRFLLDTLVVLRDLVRIRIRLSRKSALSRPAAQSDPSRVVGP
jgi:dolichyl-phosphate beta-glucosyltransferase